MAQLILNDLPDALISQLKRRAADAGISAEEEHRRILQEALVPPPRFTPEENRSFVDFLRSMPDGGSDEDFARQSSRWREIDLS